MHTFYNGHIHNFVCILFGQSGGGFSLKYLLENAVTIPFTLYANFRRSKQATKCESKRRNKKQIKRHTHWEIYNVIEFKQEPSQVNVCHSNIYTRAHCGISHTWLLDSIMDQKKD